MYLVHALPLWLLVVSAGGALCPEECACEDGDEMEYRCLVDNSTITIVAQINSYVNIDCMGANLSCSLPRLDVGRHAPLPSLSLRSCVVQDLRCVLDALQAPRVGSVALVDARSDVGRVAWAGLGVTRLTVFTAVAQDVPTAALSADPLRSFRLNGGHVTLAPDSFLQAAALKYLELSADHIQAIPRGAFRGLRDLQMLNLFGNNITVLQEGAFEGLPALLGLSLSTSNVRRLEAGVFVHTPLLHNFTMLRAHMTRLGDVFSQLAHLERVTISNDLPLSLPALSSPSLQQLSLSSCRLSSPPALATPQLQSLSLSNNQLTRLPDLQNLTLLTQLTADHNLLEVLPEDQFLGLKQLQQVSLSHNRLHAIAGNAFRGAGSLRRLSLSHNMLTLEEGAGRGTYGNLPLQSPFHALRALVDLDLSHNKIRQIFHDWGRVLLQLKSLDLSWNSFDMITSSEIQFLGVGTRVDLSHNNISSVALEDAPAAEGGAAPASRGRMLLASNPLRCDCRLLGLVRRLRGAVALAAELAPDASRAHCAAPRRLRGRPLPALAPADLACERARCPAGCACLYWPAARADDLACRAPPPPLAPDDFDAPLRRLRLRTPLDSFASLPPAVTLLNLTGLAMTAAPAGAPPPGLRLIDLTDNLLEDLPADLLEHDVTVLLAGNPISCCDADGLSGVGDARELRCGACASRAGAVALLCAAAAAAGVALLALAGGVRWRREARVWLVTRGWLGAGGEEADGGEEYDAFVSFAHGDAEWVRARLLPALEREWRVCVHYRDWAVGELIPAQIARSVGGARRTLAVVSPHFARSRWARLEFRAAAHRALAQRRATLLVLLLDDALPAAGLDPELRAYLATSTYLSASDPHFWAKLRRAMPPPRQDPSPRPLPAGPLDVALAPDGRLVHVDAKLRKEQAKR